MQTVLVGERWGVLFSKCHCRHEQNHKKLLIPETDKLNIISASIQL